VVCLKRHSTRAQRSFEAGTSRTFCFPEIMQKSRGGEESKRLSERGRTVRIC
jgi:hypothetical protein